MGDDFWGGKHGGDWVASGRLPPCSTGPLGGRHRLKGQADLARRFPSLAAPSLSLESWPVAATGQIRLGTVAADSALPAILSCAAAYRCLCLAPSDHRATSRPTRQMVVELLLGRHPHRFRTADARDGGGLSLEAGAADDSAAAACSQAEQDIPREHGGTNKTSGRGLESTTCKDRPSIGCCMGGDRLPEPVHVWRRSG